MKRIVSKVQLRIKRKAKIEHKSRRVVVVVVVNATQHTNHARGGGSASLAVIAAVS